MRHVLIGFFEAFRRYTLREIPLIAFGVIGLGLILYAQMAKWKVRRSASWLSVTAQITGSEVVKERRRRATVYVAHVEYNYEVEGTEYSNDTICVGGELNTSFRSRAEQRCAKYPLGVGVCAYYDPEDPSRACLERRAEGTALSTLIGIGSLLLGLLVYLGVIG